MSSGMPDTDRTAERIHPAAAGVLLYLFVAVGRLPELVPALAPLHLGKVALLLGLLGLLIGGGRPVMPVLSTGPGRLLAAFLLLAVLSVGFSIWMSYSLGFVLSQLLSSALLFFLLVRTATGVRMLMLYASGLLVSGLLLALMMIRAGGAERVAIVSSYDPNDLALVLVAILPLAVVSMLVARGARRYLLGGVTALVLLAILMTSSRGGFLALVTVALYLLFARLPGADGRIARRLTPGKLLIALLAVVLLTVATPQRAWDRIATVFSPEDDYNVTADTGRLAIWKRGLGAMAQRPWGWGVYAFEAVEGARGGRHQAAHNSFIQVGVELGVIGLGLYLAMLRLCWLRLGTLQVPTLSGHGQARAEQRLYMLATALRGSLIGFVVAGFFLSAAYAALLFVLFALVAAAENVAAGVRAAAPPASATPDTKQPVSVGRGIAGDRRRADTGYGY